MKNCLLATYKLFRRYQFLSGILTLSKHLLKTNTVYKVYLSQSTGGGYDYH